MRHAMARALVAALLLGITPLPASAACAALQLRTFTPEERHRFETQYGVNWWKALGLIPGPESADDYVQRPFGDSTITVFMPQQFWDPRGCATGTDRPAPPRPAPTRSLAG
jgi:hypothetical protein